MKLNKLNMTLILLLVTHIAQLFGGLQSPQTVLSRIEEANRLNRNLWWAALEGDIPKVNQYLQRGANPNFILEHRQLRFGPLRRTARTRIPILSRGGAIASERAPAMSVLEQALQRNQEDVARALLRAGATIDHPDNFGKTALIRAAARGDLPMVKRLLQLGADVNREAQNGYSALIAAAQYENRPLVRFLLKQGANVPQESSSEWTTLTGFDADNVIIHIMELIEQERRALVEQMLHRGEIEGTPYIPRDVARLIGSELESSEAWWRK